MNINHNKKGFTLIELLAVIIILALLVLIAVPSVSAYINNSRKKAFVANAKTVLKGAIADINSGKYDVYDVDTTYYIPAKCFETETGGETSSFGGDWDKQYVAVTYDGDGFDYYYTSVDSTKNGAYLVYGDLLDESFIKTGITDLPTTIGIGEREKLVTFDSSCSDNSTPEASTVEYQIYDETYYDPEVGVQFFRMDNECTVGGKNGTITGCGNFNGQKYIDTGIKPYSKENATKDYEVSFDIIDFNPNDQAGETQATIFACKLETGNYPGIVARRAGSNFEIRHKMGSDNKGQTFDPTTINSVKVVRKNNIVYYSYNGRPLEKLQDMTGFNDYFDNSLWIGAAQDKNGNPFRYGKFKIANLVARLGQYTDVNMENNMHTVFSLNNCTFNGKDGVITNCGSYNGQKYIDTGISLYGSETYKKDFMISFDVNISSTQDQGESQPTLLAAKLESGTFPGIVFRKSSSNMELNQRLNGSKVDRTIAINKLRSIKIYRKSGTVYYIFNDDLIAKLQDGQSFNEFFNDTLWIGAAKNSSGVPFRHMRASISNLVIKTS